MKRQGIYRDVLSGSRHFRGRLSSRCACPGAPPLVAWLDCDYRSDTCGATRGIARRRSSAVDPDGCGRTCRACSFPCSGFAVRWRVRAARRCRSEHRPLPVVPRAAGPVAATAQPLWWGVPLLLSAPPRRCSGHCGGFRNQSRILAGHRLVASGRIFVMGAWRGASGAWRRPAAARLARPRCVLVAAGDPCAVPGPCCCSAPPRHDHGAGTRRLDLLGGLIHRMPVTAMCFFAGLFGAAMLPPGLGFAGFWLLFQSLLGAFRIGGFGLQLLIAFAVLLAGMSVGLARDCGGPVCRCRLPWPAANAAHRRRGGGPAGSSGSA